VDTDYGKDTGRNSSRDVTEPLNSYGQEEYWRLGPGRKTMYPEVTVQEKTQKRERNVGGHDLKANWRYVKEPAQKRTDRGGERSEKNRIRKKNHERRAFVGGGKGGAVYRGDQEEEQQLQRSVGSREKERSLNAYINALGGRRRPGPA